MTAPKPTELAEVKAVGVSINGVAQNGWCIMERPMMKWMITDDNWGNLASGKRERITLENHNMFNG